MSCNIFTYGSLMFPDVWKRVVRGAYSSVKAELAEHARYAIDGESYPGMVTQTDATVEGILYLDIDAADLACLDAFEGIDYRRAAVDVHLPDGAKVAAQAYLYQLPQCLLHTEWKAVEFDIHRFLHTYCPNS